MKSLTVKRITTIYVTLVVGVFVVLASLYLIDGNYRHTQRLVEAKGNHTAQDFMLSSLNVTCMTQDEMKRIWIGTSAGINVYDGQEFVQYFHDSQDSMALPDDYINTMHRDRHDRLWIGTQNGLASYEGGSRFRRYALPAKGANITRIVDGDNDDEVKVNNGKAWFCVKRDGHVAPTDAPRHGLLSVAPLPIDSLQLNKPVGLVACTYLDRDSNLWIGYRNAGYQMVSQATADFTRANNNPLRTITEGKDITCLRTVGQHLLAATTLRLFVYHSQSKRWSDIYYTKLFHNATPHKQELIDMVALDEQHVWLVGNKEILTCQLHDGQLQTRHTTRCHPDGEGQLGAAARLGRSLYVVSTGGRLACVDDKGDIQWLPIQSPWYDEETQPAPLHDGRLLLFMRDMHVAIYNPANHSLMPVATQGHPNHNHIDPAFALQDHQGTIWLGTKRYGLYRFRLDERKMERMTFVNDVHIQAMEEDRLGHLWITTLKDAICYNTRNGNVMMSSIASGSQTHVNRQFFDRSICLAQSGDVVFGSSNGCLFQPTDDFDATTSTRELYITQLDVTTTDDEQLTINDGFRDGAHYTFAHDDNEMTLRFYHPDYSQRATLMYQYMLEGHDHDWQEPTYKHTAHYDNLRPGQYTFRVRLIAAPDLPPLAERFVHVTLRRAPWQCAAAWWLYFNVVMAFMLYINRLYLRLRAHRINLLHEQHEREREQRTNEMNMRFFANISHEFRNPITLIAGPLISMRNNQQLPASVKSMLNTVCMSVNRMLRLIDQMLDFNQLETDALRLRVSEIVVAEVLRPLADSFACAANERQIHLVVSLPDARVVAWADADKLEKMVSNLFTNALKHTPAEGAIRLKADVEEKENGRWLCVSVWNSGSHIDSERLDDVFKRYYQLTDTQTEHRYGWGTGIGLYYVKRLVMLHHGWIVARNDDGEDGGVTFSLALPAVRDAYENAARMSEQSHTTMQLPITPMENGAEEKVAEKSDDEHRKRILIVDDDIDVAKYVRSLFADHYQVVNRYSAEEALADLKEINPDIILTDIIMGKMSGYDLCKKIKGNLMFSHIPVVMITAKSNIDEQISGLRLGAVAYVTKPFDPSYLRALVVTQLNNIEALQHQLGDSTETSAMADVLTEQDQRFMDELYALMAKRCGEQELNVTTICHDMLISASKFNYKVKQLTGETPGNLFRRYKLNKAAELLKAGKYNISEVALHVGFNTAAHFSVAFKKQFGVSPSEFLSHC